MDPKQPDNGESPDRNKDELPPSIKEIVEQFRPWNPLSPELREWLLKQTTETDEEIMAALREVRENGGEELGEIIREFEQGLLNVPSSLVHPIPMGLRYNG